MLAAAELGQDFPRPTDLPGSSECVPGNISRLTERMGEPRETVVASCVIGFLLDGDAEKAKGLLRPESRDVRQAVTSFVAEEFGAETAEHLRIEEQHRPFYKNPLFWLAIGGGTIAISGTAWYVYRRRR